MDFNENDIDVYSIGYLRSFHAMIMSIPDDALQLEAFRAVTNYMMTGIEPDEMSWQVKIIMEGVKPVIDKSREKSKAGQTKSEENQTEIKTKSNENQNEIKQKSNKEQKKNIEEDKEEDKEKDKEKDKKHKYGEYAHVMLTDEELSKLEAEYGADKTADAIRCLDEYIEMKGTKYKSHYLAMRKWAFDAVNEHLPRGDTDDGRDEWLSRQKGGG